MGISEFFLAQRIKGRKIFMPYFTLGYPTPESSLRLVKAAIDGGADALELGIPFSDPIADGPVIQRSTQGALLAGTTPDICFDLLKRIRDYSPIPIGLLLYYNLIHACGLRNFSKKAAESGVQAILAADLPVEESRPFIKALEKDNLQSVFMIALNTGDEKLRRIIAATTGYLYLMAVMGVTGERRTVSERCLAYIDHVRSITNHPICVGFGISTPEHARAFSGTGADGIIVGSALTRLIEEHRGNMDEAEEAVRHFVRSFTAPGRS